jgi:hypothetical protein
MAFVSEEVAVEPLSSEKLAEPWPEGIPRNYDEMLKTHGAYVIYLIRKYNKVDRNFEELHSYIWARLIQMDIIRLYVDGVNDKVQSTMTALECCELLGVTFGQWRTKMWAYHMGDPVVRNGQVICRRMGGWMPTPINIEEFEKRGQKGYSAKTARFDSDDIGRLMGLERMLKNGSIRGPFSKYISDPQFIELKATKGHFQSYVAKAIWSNFLNWCRTFRRKWALDQPKKLPTDQDNDEHNWESNIPDPRGTRQETVAVVRQALSRLSEALYESMDGVPSCKPVAQYEMQMYELLEQGVQLNEVVNRLEVPDKTKRAILRSVMDIRPRA